MVMKNSQMTWTTTTAVRDCGGGSQSACRRSLGLRRFSMEMTENGGKIAVAVTQEETRVSS